MDAALEKAEALLDRQRYRQALAIVKPVAARMESTLNRDLTILREAGLFITGADNQYALTKSGRACLRKTVSSGPKS